MKNGHMLNQLGWWFLFLVCTFYGLYAFYLGALEILHQLAVLDEVKFRNAPIIFIIHALVGGVGLISGALQFNRTLLINHKSTHRLIGKIYVYAISITSIASFWSALLFDVGTPAKIAFAVLATLWAGTTTVASLHIRKRRIRQHREWMIRSFSLSLFFVTFSIWVPVLAESALPHNVAYPLAVFLSWALNLLVAELWIRRSQNGDVRRDLAKLQAEVAGD